jgi:hypothetical protein
MKRISILLFFVLCISLLPVAPAHAQGTTPPVVDPNGAWGEVVDQNGNILYENMTDLGIVQQPAGWMPDIPGIGTLPAEYHVYQTPSGNIVVMPTPMTLFFMALNPDASGLNQSDAMLGTGAGFLATVLGGYIDPATIAGMGYSNQADFFNAVINGQANIWTVLGPNTFGFLQSLLYLSITDQNVYLLLLLYTQGNCASAPGGCPNLPQPPPPSLCPLPVTQLGAITVTGQKLAPNFPLVVGQDESKRGVDATWEVRVEPTIYTSWTPVPESSTCDPITDASTQEANCTQENDDSGTLNIVWVCQQNTQVFRETLNWETAYASLGQASRNWILNELSIRYPEAYLHHPSFSFPGFLGTGGFQGDTYVWTLTRNNIQAADPGYFDLRVAGSTSGTPVSAPRGFNRSGGQFGVYLKESVIIR